MKLTKRNIVIITSLVAVTGTVVFIAIRRKSNNKKIKELNDILDGRAQNPNAPQGTENYWNLSYASKYSKNPAFWEQKNIKDFVKDLAKSIYDSVGYSYDEPNKALAAFKKINSKVGVSKVSEAFNTKYNKDMYDYLEKGFDTDEQAKVFSQIKQYTDSLPIIVGNQ